MMVMMSRAIKKTISFGAKSRMFGSVGGAHQGGGMRALINTACATECYDEDSGQNRADVNGDQENVWVGRIYTVSAKKHGDYDDHDHTVVSWK